MAGTSRTAWKTILGIGGLAFVIFLIVSGQLLIGGVLLILLLILGGGAFLYRKDGPPSR